MLALRTVDATSGRIELTEVAEPAPAPNEAVVALHATSVNRGEVGYLEGVAPDYPLGWDVAGVVVAAARDGSGPAVGARVAGVTEYGGWGERVAVPAHQLTELPCGLDFVTAAALPLAGLTAVRALEMGGWLLGRRVLVTGAAGGVGRLAVQLAALSGARVTAVVGRAERARGLPEIGAAEVAVGIESATGRFDLVLESIGGDSLSRGVTVLAPDGLLVTYGRSSRQDGVLPVRFFGTHPEAAIRPLNIFQELVTRRSGSKQLALLVDLVATGRLDPQVTVVRDWRDADEVATALRARRVLGKAVLTVAA